MEIAAERLPWGDFFDEGGETAEWETEISHPCYVVHA